MTSAARRAGLYACLFLLTVGCAEIEPPDSAAAEKLAQLRAEAEETPFLVYFQKDKKAKATSEAERDSYDNAAALRESKDFQDKFERVYEAKFAEAQRYYETLAADVVNRCIIRAQRGMSAGQIDACAAEKPKGRIDPVKFAGSAVGLGILLLVAVRVFRTARRSIDPVALAANKLGLKAEQDKDRTLLDGEYKGFKIHVEASAPEAGEGDVFTRVSVLSNLDATATVRFGPLAPPTGLEMPDLDAPEVRDPRIPAGYKLRLSPGAGAEDLLSGDVGFQVREYDPVDIRVFDGQCNVTTWFLFTDSDKVVEFVDIAVAVAESYRA